MCKYVVDFSFLQDSILGKCILSMMTERGGILSVWDHQKRMSVYDGGSHRLIISIEDTVEGFTTIVAFLRLMGGEFPQISGLIEDIIAEIYKGRRMVIVRKFKNCKEIQIA